MRTVIDDRVITPTLIDVKTLSRRLGLSPRHVWRLRDAGKIPQSFHVAGTRSVRWQKHEIDDWIAAGCPERRYAAARTA